MSLCPSRDKRKTGILATGNGNRFCLFNAGWVFVYHFLPKDDARSTSAVHKTADRFECKWRRFSLGEFYFGKMVERETICLEEGLGCFMKMVAGDVLFFPSEKQFGVIPFNIFVVISILISKKSPIQRTQQLNLFVYTFASVSALDTV